MRKFKYVNTLQCILLLVVIVITGCSSTGNESSNNAEDDRLPYYWEDFYENASYDKYKTPASENGLANTLIYIEGTIKEVINISGTDMPTTGIIINDKDDNKWMAIIATNDNEIPKLNEKITAYMSYMGISTNYNDYPCGHLVRYIKWIGDNNWIDVNNMKSGDNKSTYLYLAYESEPTYIVDYDIESENDVDYYNVYLSEDIIWSDLDEEKKIRIAQDIINYFRDYSYLNFHDSDIICIDSIGNNTFYFNYKKSSEIRFYNNGVLDYDYEIY